MASYIIRKLEEVDWPAIKAKAALEQKSVIGCNADLYEINTAIKRIEGKL